MKTLLVQAASMAFFIVRTIPVFPRRPETMCLVTVLRQQTRGREMPARNRTQVSGRVDDRTDVQTAVPVPPGGTFAKEKDGILQT